jgi:uncharacterized protein (TIGR02285 family)
MLYRIGTHLLAGFLYLVMYSHEALAIETKSNTIHWVLLDFPPFLAMPKEMQDTDSNSLAEAKGPFAEIHRELEKALPEYSHTYRMVTFQRAQKLFESKKQYCTILFFKTPAREQYLIFGGALASTIAPGIILDERRIENYKDYMKNSEVDLPGLLQSPSFRLGVVEGRSFSSKIDGFVEDSKNPVFRNISDRTMGGLFKMLAAKRLDGVLGYYLELANEQKNNPDTKTLHFYPIQQEKNILTLRVSCEKSPWGADTVRKITEVTKKEAVRAKVSNLLLQTLPPDMKKNVDEPKVLR